MRGIIVLFLTLSLISFGCKDQSKTSGASQMEEVLSLHDEVMPKMSTIAKLVGELKSKVDSTDQGLEYASAMEDLQDSHKAMMDWMQGFGTRFTSDEILNGAPLTEEKQDWLDEEEEKVIALKKQILESIESAQEILDQ
ncbi:MAG: hypothetical protein OER83_03940 [Flavobacteriaceae bacterium]|nr:hypothetical protein [Flavobacteriaceae bacterium]MDH3796005.1 hypothetical protein [Flavobacteriaceae bacterium]